MKEKTSKRSRNWAMLDYLEGKISYREVEKRAEEYEKSLKELERQLNVKFR